MVAQPARLGRRTFPADGRVTLTAAGDARTYAGRTAALLVELALAAELYEGIEFGTLHLDLAQGKIGLRVERQLGRVHLTSGGLPVAPSPAGR